MFDGIFTAPWSDFPSPSRGPCGGRRALWITLCFPWHCPWWLLILRA